MAHDVQQGANRAGTQRVIRPMAIRHAGDGRHDDLDHRDKPRGAHRDQRRAEPPAALRQQHKDPDCRRLDPL